MHFVRLVAIIVMYDHQKKLGGSWSCDEHSKNMYNDCLSSRLFLGYWMRQGCVTMWNESLGGLLTWCPPNHFDRSYVKAVPCVTVCDECSRSIRLLPASIGIRLPYTGTEFPANAEAYAHAESNHQETYEHLGYYSVAFAESGEALA